MADKIKDDPGGDSLRFTFEVLDKASSELHKLETSFGGAAKNITALAEKIKPSVDGIQAATNGLGSSLAAAAGELDKHAASIDHTVQRNAASIDELEKQHKRIYKSYETQPIPKIVGTQEWIDQQIRLTHLAAEKLVAEHEKARSHSATLSKEWIDHLKTRTGAEATATQEYIEQTKKVAQATSELDAKLQQMPGERSETRGVEHVRSRHGGGDEGGHPRLNKISELAAGFKDFFMNPADLIGTAVAGLVGKATLDFDDAMTVMRRNIGQTDAEFAVYEDRVLAVGLAHNVLMDEMVGLSGMLSKVGQTAFDTAGEKGLGAVTEAFKGYKEAAGFTQDQTETLLATNLNFFNQTEEGLKNNADEWSRINKLTVLTHEDMFGLIDATKVAVSLAQAHGDAVEKTQENLALGADYYVRMGATTRDMIADMDKFSDIIGNFQKVKIGANVMGMEPGAFASKMARGEIAPDVLRRRLSEHALQMVTAESGGDINSDQFAKALGLVAKGGLAGTNDRRELEKWVQEALVNRKEAVAQGTTPEGLEKIAADKFAAANAALKAKGPAAVGPVLGAGEQVEHIVDQVKKTSVKGLLDVAHAIGGTSEYLSDEFGELLGALSPLVPAVVALVGVLKILKWALAGTSAAGTGAAETAGAGAGGGIVGAAKGLFNKVGGPAAYATVGALVNSTFHAITDVINEKSLDEEAAANLADVQNKNRNRQRSMGKPLQTVKGQYGGSEEYSGTGNWLTNAGKKFNQDLLHPLDTTIAAVKTTGTAYSQTLQDAGKMLSADTYQSALGAYGFGESSGAGVVPSSAEPGRYYENIQRTASGVGDWKTSSTTGGKHVPGSKHYTGDAVDFSTKGKTPQQISDLIAAETAAGNKAVWETKPPENLADKSQWGPHVHVEKANAEMITNAVTQTAARAKGQKPQDPVFMESPTLLTALSKIERLLSDRINPNAPQTNRLATGN